LGFLKQLQSKIVGIALLINHPFYPAINDKLGAYDARLVRAIHSGLVYGYSQPCRLNNGVLLGVHGVANLVPCAAWDIALFSQAIAPFGARLDAAARAVVARGDNALVLDYYRADLTVGSYARRPRTDKMCDLHKSIIPFQNICVFFQNHYTKSISENAVFRISLRLILHILCKLNASIFLFYIV
jgi:hypothetical protein